MKYLTPKLAAFNIPKRKSRTATTGLRCTPQELETCLRRNEVYEQVELRTQLFSIPMTRYQMTVDPAGVLNKLQHVIDAYREVGK